MKRLSFNGVLMSIALILFIVRIMFSLLALFGSGQSAMLWGLIMITTILCYKFVN